ncbi:bifunctional ADP-dependent NAD(P)H-hydrate dehydratase/NAD(P)H-hydrate epimerase [Malaciobacter mytili]|uniref:NAD(P)H-hydrate epimerase n=1 Tax=Malaciobacter mytili LMG 24559 TaxID=1032238 RepID=A0AAX2AGY2_9BACT|nr:NAD(P)H-hydrate dehydratase [Malaciobacter mytili]AXH13876.1 carbohydrate kinase, YjeF-related protein [Malaciobacter mytili LMG 24559]RXI37151.1 bifunctional ADP-dependent NAD(P)H-hydrate dehydratase/NAD(P)H-hydrate epimerase [Malaciobacter mytili]RXK15471.1 bifunctional ADP-dependent NAD(P)H-hydrate dehydratase/NAD(P)H-hydrate epimerase [Malaciobacter mytili LMG 24559]
MQKVFTHIGFLDEKCYSKYNLSEDILMEHAALALKNAIKKESKEYNSSILICCGVGNNAADGITLARLLQNEYKNIYLYIPFEVKSSMAKLQLQRANLLGIKQINNISSINKVDIVVDCLFGSGLNKSLDKTTIEIIEKLNNIEAFKISCDIPSGIDVNGKIETCAFIAHKTVTMGANKLALFTDIVKDYVGKIEVANLGLAKEMYEEETDIFLLEQTDMKLPFRKQKNSHKGTFGHAAIVIGCKKGAGTIACDAAFSFGSGLVTAIVHEELALPCHIMQSHKLPLNTTSIAIGMGLGLYNQDELKQILDNNIAKVIDADMFYEEIILQHLKSNVVLTPHPKEFCSLLKLTKIADISIEELQNNRFKYLKEFTLKYPQVTILLKGANTLIANNNKIFINYFGTSVLSKGGSGDVLSGLIASLLAQGYSSLDAAITASLAHTLVAKKYKKNSYSLSPQDLIEGIKIL